MPLYGTFLYGEDIFEDSIAPGSPGYSGSHGLIRVPWLLRDLSSPEDVYEFAINPLNVKQPAMEKRVSTQYTTAGNPVNWEGRPEPQTFGFSGTILTEEHFRAMEEWVEKEHQVVITDDLGVNNSVYFTKWSPKRQYHSQFPWRHEFSVDAVILSWE